MKTLNPAYVERVNQLINDSPYFKLLSMTIADAGIGFSRLEIDLAQKHLQPFGFVHGGVFASIIDAAAFWALYYEIEDPAAGATSVDLKLNYLAPAASGRLIANGRRIRLGKTLGYADAAVTDERGRLLAHGTSTLMILPGSNQLVIDQPLPPKFTAP
ncbi:MAG: PaaI family thioesterase [Syntrophales bacterium]